MEIPLIGNHGTCLLRFSSISAEFGQAMVRILTKRGRL